MKKRIKQLLIFLACILFILLLSAPFIVPWAVNTPFVKNKIAAVVKQNSGLELNPSQFSITLFPRLGIRVRDLALLPDASIKLAVKSLNLHLDLTELLSGKIILGKIIMDQPEIRMLPGVETPAEQKEKLEPLEISLPAVFDIISNTFDLIPGDSDRIELDFRNGESDFFSKAGGSLQIFKSRKKIDFNILLENIRCSSSTLLDPDTLKYIDLGSLQLHQILIEASIEASDTVRQFAGRCRIVRPVVTAEKKQVLLKTDQIDLNFNITPDQQQISMLPAALNYPDGTVGIEFMNHPSEEKARLAFTGKKINVEQGREMSLTLFKNLFVPQTLFEILLGGNVPEVDVWLESSSLKTLLNEHNLNLSGNIINGKVHIPETPLIASQINGRVTLKKGILNVISPQGMIKTSKIRTGTLAVDLLNHEDVPFKGTFDLDVDLSMLPETLGALLPDTLVAQELAGVSNVKGRTNAALNLELKTGSDEPIVHVETEEFSAGGAYNRIPGDIKVDSVLVTYKPDVIYLDSFNGIINGSIIRNLTCSVEFKNDPVLDIEKGSATLNLDRIIPWLMAYDETRQAISPISYGGGRADISTITLSGPVLTPEKWKYEINGGFSNLFVGTIQNTKQIENLFCNIKVSDKAMYVENLKAKFISLPFLETIIPSEYSDSVRLPFHIDSTRFKTDATSSLFKTKMIFEKGPVLHMDFSGKDSSSFVLNAARFIDNDMSDASISFNHEKNKPLFDFSGRLNTVSVQKMIKPQSPLDEKLKQLTGGQPVKIYSDKSGTLNIIIKELNTDFLVDTSQDDTPTLMKTTLLTDDPVNFKAEKLRFKDLVFTDVDTKISFKENHSYIRLKNAWLCDLKIQGYINLKDGKVYANIPIASKDPENIQTLLSCLIKKDNLMDGSYSFSSGLYANGVPKDELIKNVTGNLNLHTQDGRIYKWTLLSRILSVLNVSKVFQGKIPNLTQEGFAYTNIDIRADIKESVIHLSHAVIDGQDMTMIFTGTIDPLNDKLNLTCLVAPFKTVDLIIEKIPIINTLLGGRLISVPVKATGKLTDPAVIPLHPSAVGEGLVDMMSRIVKSPVTLWEKMVGEDDETD